MEQSNQKPPILVDKEASQRYKHIIDAGKRIFAGSAIVDPSKPITADEIDLIAQFHKEVSPENPQASWRLTREDRSIERGQIADSSFFSNWEVPGGPLEHIELATQAALIIVEELKTNLKSADSVLDLWVKEAISAIQGLNPYHTAVVAGLHDEGREVTHLLSNEVIGRRLLQRIGIREDITSILPDEKVMQVPLNESMDEYMQHMNPETIIVRIADDFGKRKGETNRLQQPQDINHRAEEAWAQNYLKRPFSGRPFDRLAREHLELHVENAPRYLEALDNWLDGISTLSLSDITRRLNQQLAPTLKPLVETAPLSTKDMLDGQAVTKTIEVGKKQVTIEAMMRIGGPNKKANEDGFVTITDGKTLQVILVDGGTQVEKVESLDQAGLTGGKYIATKVEEYGSILNPNVSIVRNLHILNRFIGEDVAKNHSDIQYAKDSMNVPYGSIAGARFDSENNTLEVANAGDVNVVTIDDSGEPTLLTVDDVYKKDQQTFKAAKKIAEQYGLTMRQVMEQIGKDPRMKPVLEEEYECMRQGNSGEIRRISGSPNFDVTSSVVVNANIIKQVLLFSDGGVPGGIDIRTEEGLQQFVGIVDDSGLEGLNGTIKQNAADDPDFNTHPRFRDIDDFLFVRIEL